MVMTTVAPLGYDNFSDSPCFDFIVSLLSTRNSQNCKGVNYDLESKKYKPNNGEANVLDGKSHLYVKHD